MLQPENPNLNSDDKETEIIPTILYDHKMRVQEIIGVYLILNKLQLF